MRFISLLIKASKDGFEAQIRQSSILEIRSLIYLLEIKMFADDDSPALSCASYAVTRTQSERSGRAGFWGGKDQSTKEAKKRKSETAIVL